jgi:hypothetical protein
MKEATRVVTFEALDGSGFRLITPFGNRDFDNGILSTDDNDPALLFLLEWAGKKKGIKVTDTGKVTQVAVMTCPVCGQKVSGTAELSDHTEAKHVRPESKGQPKRRRK